MKVKFVAFLAVIASIVTVSCKKETIAAKPVSSSSVSAATVADSIQAAISPWYVLGEYSTRGSRTIYNGQANENGDNIKLSLDYFGTKTMTVAPDKKHLLLPFGEQKYVNKGWAYVIRYDFDKKKVIAEPNDAMKSGIVPGSFESLYADYSPRYQSWTFQTRFTALDDNGNESEVIEPLGK